MRKLQIYETLLNDCANGLNKHFEFLLMVDMNMMKNPTNMGILYPILKII